jgi:tRNA 2-thiouridine synthesizing protein B
VINSDLRVQEAESRNADGLKRHIFLLTKPPGSERTKLCLRLMERTNAAVLYLAGDGVFNLLGDSLDVLAAAAVQSPVRIYACREDMQARGLKSAGKATVLDDFYDRLVADMMDDENRVYSF